MPGLLLGRLSQAILDGVSQAPITVMSSATFRSVGPLGEPATVEFLRILRREFAQSLAPELVTDRSKVLLNMSLSLLDYLILREGGLDALTARRQDSVRHALEALGYSGTPAGEASLQLLEEQLSRKIEAAERTAEERSRTYDILHRLMQEERSYLDALSSPAPQAQGVQPVSSDTFAERLGCYLQSKRPDGLAVNVKSVGNPQGGYSKDVFVVELDGPGRLADRVVIRCDRPLGPLESSVSSEYAVLKAAAAADVPVAKPLLLEPDPSVLGAPFLVLEFVEGKPSGDFMRNVSGQDPRTIFRQLAQVLARIHAIDPATADIPRSELERPLHEHIRNLLDRFEEQWRRRRSEPSPVLAAALAWMRANMPVGGGQPVIVHADPTTRNLLLAGGKISALLDWETWHVGDPAEDLAYCKDEIAGQMDWQEFRETYTAAGGRDVAEERVQYWMMWKYLFGSISSTSMMQGIGVDPGTDLRTAFGAVYFTSYCVGRVADLLSKTSKT